MLSARELNQSKLPADAQTWINQRFKFTHGNGIAMNPVNRFDEEGLPVFYVKDIPPVASAGAASIDRPEIYFGEETRNYVVVGGDTKEFDYAKGQENVYNVYQGRDGVSLGSLWTARFICLVLRRFQAADQRQRNLVQPDPVSAPDSGPHPANRAVSPSRSRSLSGRKRRAFDLVAGRLHGRATALPYSQRSRPGGINYIRNSVKIAVDAYDGNPVFYIADPTDPIVQTYQRIFPIAVSANGVDAGFVAQTYPLSGRSFYPSSERLRHLSHEGPGGVLQQRRSVELSQGESQRANRDHAAVLHDYALARRAARGIHFDAADGAEQSRQHDRVAGRALRRCRITAR